MSNSTLLKIYARFTTTVESS
uniref:Uncharacterized protein n=1 Tax=Anguilla anguilla TaxID=7936 RepID=A0A0E9SI43_ANGAN